MKSSLLVGQLAQALHEFLGGGMTPARPHRFQHDGDGLVVDQLAHRFQVVDLGLGEAFDLRANILSQPGLPDADMVASVRPWKPWFMVMIL